LGWFLIWSIWDFKSQNNFSWDYKLQRFELYYQHENMPYWVFGDFKTHIFFLVVFMCYVSFHLPMVLCVVIFCSMFWAWILLVASESYFGLGMMH
jgi:hypothetical protein